MVLNNRRSLLLEDADYDGRSLSMLQKIAIALNQKVEIKFTSVATKKGSGTIRNKPSFCNKALPKIRYSDLPPSTQEVIRKIYKFIKDQNS
ncbi:MAG: hypothetical protein ACKPCM_10430 [Pseudanabaena sp.]